MSANRGENNVRDTVSIHVDGRRLLLPRGMTVRHALISAGLLLHGGEAPVVRDEWGNQTGLEGALTEGVKLFTSKK